MTQPRMALPVILERLAFAFLILLALAFPFEIPLSNQQLAFTNIEVLEILAIGCWLLSHFTSKTLPRFPTKLLLPVILWLAVLAISTVLAPDSLTHTIRFMSRVVQGLLLAWIAYDLVDNSTRWQMVIKALVVAGLVVALLGLGEAANISPIVNLLTVFRATQTHVGDVIRVSSSLEYATVAAMVLEMLISLTISWAVTTKQNWLRFGLIIVILIDVVTLVLTLTRSAVLGLAIALIVIAAISLWKRQRLNAIAAGGTLIATAGTIAVLLITNPAVGLRLLSESENGWYQARYVAPAELTSRPNEWLTVPVEITNVGLRRWSASATPAFRLGYTLISATDSKDKGLDGIRTELPADVAPGQSLSVQAQVPAPETAGRYLIQWDMVEETVLWFSWRGSPLGSTMLTVAGTPLTNVQHPKLSPANHSTESPPVERPVLWQTALKMFRERPLFGVGPDNFRWVYGQYLGFDHWDTNVHANSIYFEALADTGLLGLLAFLWLNWRWLHLVVQRFNTQTDRYLWIWQLALIASMIAWFVHGMFDYFYEFAGTYILFWLIAGLAISTAIQAPMQRAQEV